MNKWDWDFKIHIDDKSSCAKLIFYIHSIAQRLLCSMFDVSCAMLKFRICLLVTLYAISSAGTLTVNNIESNRIRLIRIKSGFLKILISTCNFCNDCIQFFLCDA